MVNENTSGNGGSNIYLIRKVAHWLILCGGALIGSAYLVFTTYNIWNDPALRKVVQDHFAAVIGLPAAAIASLCVVLILEGTAGPIEFEGLGFKFKGASGPIIFWIICFLVITGAIRICW
jgi:hypothetical protein